MHCSIGQLAKNALGRTGSAVALSLASPGLVWCRDSEILTTKDKQVDVSKAVRSLKHRDTHSLEEGMRLTAEWMRTVYNFQDAGVPAD